MRVRNRRPDGQGRETLIADMSVGYKMIRERFTSRVVLDKPRLRVVVEYIDGPFSHMENIWTFRDEPEARASLVTFFIDYEFRSRTLGALMGSMFDAAFRKFAAGLRGTGRRDLSGRPVVAQLQARLLGATRASCSRDRRARQRGRRPRPERASSAIMDAPSR